MKAKIGEYHRVTGDIFSMSEKEILQNRWQSVADKLLQVSKTEDPEDLTEFATASLFLQDIANIKKEFKRAAEISEETIDLYLKSFLKNYPESCHKLLTDEFLYILSPFHYKVRWNKEQKPKTKLSDFWNDNTYNECEELLKADNKRIGIPAALDMNGRYIGGHGSGKKAKHKGIIAGWVLAAEKKGKFVRSDLKNNEGLRNAILAQFQELNEFNVKLIETTRADDDYSLFVDHFTNLM